jgi:hypothetical protein
MTPAEAAREVAELSRIAVGNSVDQSAARKRFINALAAAERLRPATA